MKIPVVITFKKGDSNFTLEFIFFFISTLHPFCRDDKSHIKIKYSMRYPIHIH